MKKIFLNLTNGIEALEKNGFNIDEVNFIRIQSCHIESRKWELILDELDYNFMMFLAMGFECEVHDCGAQCETSKAVYYGVEWVRFVLNKRWLKQTIIPIVKGKNVLADFEKKYSEISRKSRHRLDYFVKYLNTDTLKLTSVTFATLNDNKPEYYIGVISQALKNI